LCGREWTRTRFATWLGLLEVSFGEDDGVTVDHGDGVAGTAISRSSWLGAPGSLIAEPPYSAAAVTAALTTTAALAEAIRSPVPVTVPPSRTTTPEQVTI
jgi:hypothetical protein